MRLDHIFTFVSFFMKNFKFKSLKKLAPWPASPKPSKSHQHNFPSITNENNNTFIKTLSVIDARRKFISNCQRCKPMLNPSFFRIASHEMNLS